MSYPVLRVKNPENQVQWEKQLTSNEEALQIKWYCEKGRTVDFFSAALSPVRTHNFKDFLEDFFLPTVLNRALHVNNLVGKIFALIGALIFDLLTFPCRLFTFIPRWLDNPPPSKHPFYQYLRKEHAPETLTDSTHLDVEFITSQSTYERKGIDEQGKMHSIQEKTVVKEWSRVHVSDVPAYPGSTKTQGLAFEEKRSPCSLCHRENCGAALSGSILV